MVRPAAPLSELYREGTYALVTGASAGLGILFAAAFAERGCNLILAARSVDKLDEVKARIEKGLADKGSRHLKTIKIVVMHADLGTPEGAGKLVKDIRAKGITPLIVVNNAGSGTFGDLDEIEEDKAQQEFCLLATSVMTLSRAFLPDMKAAHRGGILNISSIAGWLPLPWGTIYSGGKAFNKHFSCALHSELKGTHPRCTVSCPGPILTDIWEKAGDIDANKFVLLEDADTVVARTMRAFENDHAYCITGWWYWWSIKLSPLGPSWLTDMIARNFVRRAISHTGAQKVDQTPKGLKV